MHDLGVRLEDIGLRVRLNSVALVKSLSPNQTLIHLSNEILSIPIEYWIQLLPG